MTCWKSAPILRLLLVVLALLSSTHGLDHTTANGGIGRRVLLSFKETPRGTNLTFDCSPSGPCVPCAYSEKKHEKYRCSETGYRIPLKCVEIKHGMKNEYRKHSQNNRSTLEISNGANVELQDTTSHTHRTLLDDSSTPNGGSQTYITYKSCIPTNAEMLSVIGFEAIILCLLLISGSVVYFRRKQNVTMMAGAGRIQMTSRF